MAILSNRFRTALADVELRSEGVVVVRIRPDVVETLEAAREVNQAIRRLCSSRLPRPVLYDMRAPHSVTASARRYAGSEQVREVTQKLALLVSSPVSRMLGTAYMLPGKLRQPTRLFHSEEEAVAWLTTEQ